MTEPLRSHPSKGRPKHRHIIERVPRFRICPLLKNLGFGRHTIRLGQLSAELFLSDREASWITVRGRKFRLVMKGTRGRPGGYYWLVECPTTRKRVRDLYFGDIVGSRFEVDAVYLEWRLTPRKRAIVNKAKLWGEMWGNNAIPSVETLEKIDAIPARPGFWIGKQGQAHPRRMRKKRYDRMLKRLVRRRRTRESSPIPRPK